MRVLVTGVAALAVGIYAENAQEKEPSRGDPVLSGGQGDQVARFRAGERWGLGTGWRGTSYVRQGERLESKGNDVANTAVAPEALLHTGTTLASGPHRESLARG
jgi:hypothetical protein